MSNEIQDYVILFMECATDLSLVVRQHLADGWVLYGTPTCSVNEKDKKDYRFTQCMVKFKTYFRTGVLEGVPRETTKFEPGIISNPKADVAGEVAEALRQKAWDDIHKKQFEDLPRQSFCGVDGKPND